MNTNRQANGKQGYALIISLIFVGLIAMGSILLFRSSSQEAFVETKRANHIRATMIAEAGAHQAMVLLKADPSQVDEPVPDVSINGGTCSSVITDPEGATVNSAGGAGANNVVRKLLTSTGSYGGEEVDAALIFTQSDDSGSSGTDPHVLELFDGALFCGGNALMDGATYIDLAGATAHVNGQITMTGSAQFRNGTLVSTCTGIYLSGYPEIFASVATPTTPSIPWGSPSTFIHGTIAVGSVPEEMIEIDLEPYRVYALAGDIPGHNYQNVTWNYQYTDPYISADEIPGGTLKIVGNSYKKVVPVGGVLWVEGNVEFTGDSPVYACVIATGSISFKGATIHLQQGGLPALMTINGTLEVGAGCTVYGLVYSHNGDIVISGDATVEGAFICPRGNFTNHGSGKIKYDNSRPYGPNGEIVMLPTGGSGGSSGGPASVSAWVK